MVLVNEMGGSREEYCREFLPSIFGFENLAFFFQSIRYFKDTHTTEYVDSDGRVQPGFY